jgi:single-stranded-DNA-specific exonuclease
MYDWEILSSPENLESLKEKLIENKLKNFTEEEFYNPPHPVNLLNIKNFDSELFESLKKAKEIIFEAVSQNLLILIHGDYDSDGVCATTILYQTIKNTLNYPNVFTLIPDRFEDGYGLSDKTVKKLLDLAFNQKFLLITVDCGITSIDQIRYLKDLGNKVILTDHHHKPEVTPEADVIVWDDSVVGSTIAWFLALGLGNKDPKIMSLASIATVTDVFPLIGFNRSLLKHGLDSLKTNPHLSIETILDFNNKNYKDISVYELGFVIGPRLNSSGRIGSADTSLELLNAETRNKAWELVSVINEINLQRQKITEDSLSVLQVDELNLPKIIIVFNENFHEGVMGLIASKLVQKYNRPALVVSKNEDKYKGSARSIKGINIIEILKNFTADFLSVGGHDMAAGFSFSPEKYEIIKNNIEKHMEINYQDFNFNKKITVNARLDSSFINLDLLNFIGKLEPFGNGNEEPLFCINNLIIKEIRFLGEKKNHVSLILSDSIREFKGLIFGFDPKLYDLYLGLKIDIAFKIRKNEYRGKTSIDLNIVDLKISNA